MRRLAAGIVAFAWTFAVSGAAPLPALRAQEQPPPGFALELGDARDATVRVTTHAEHAAFALRVGESLHPEIAAEGLRAAFVGELRCTRSGRIRFGVDVEGGEAALTFLLPSGAGGGAHMGPIHRRDGDRDGGSVGREMPRSLWSEWLDVTPGTIRLTVTFTREAARAARLRTSWEMERDAGGGGFAAEPIAARDVRVPADHGEVVLDELRARRGRVWLSELGCVQCHAAGERGGFAAPRREPIALDGVASRAGDEWLAKWILEPQRMKPGCGMPGILGATKQELADAAALTMLFASLVRDATGALAPPVAPIAPATPAAETAVDEAQAARGRELFHQVGCIGCHGPLEAPAAAFGDAEGSRTLPTGAAAVPLGELAHKWRVGALAAFLRDPRAVRPHGRMPSLALDENEATAIARYLCGWFGAAAAPAAVVVPDATAIERGKQVFNTRGCAQCHTLGRDLDGPPNGTFAKPLIQLDPRRGCLAPNERAHGDAPRYKLADDVCADLRAGLESIKRASGAPAPLDATQRALTALHCTACHERDKQGGVSAPLQPYFKGRTDADLGDEGRLPPRLDGVGLRLQSPWLQKVVSDGARARPWLWTRMPAFGDDVGEPLASGLAAIEGEWRSDAKPFDLGVMNWHPQTSEELAVAGRRLAGSGGLNCITCHSFADRPSAGTPGLDFTQFASRIRREWWQRYALSPLRFKPGTRMPTFFENGKSAAAAVLDGDATAQIDALWAWFERAGSMPAPEGVPTGQRMVLDVGDRPRIFRAFLERAGNRAIAVGFPSGLHFAFDAEQIRLCEAWRGEFLDVAPVWTGRGGNVAPQLGPVVWSAAPGPALLLERPSGAWPADSGRNHGLKFCGYRIEPDGTPVFLWDLRKAGTPADAPSRSDAVHVEETFVPDARPDVLFVRTLRVTNLPKGTAVFIAPARTGDEMRASSGGSVVAGFVEECPGATLAMADDPPHPLVLKITVKR